jgi:D-beta-D-heptose 7-phosphate kinase / D-beta-D-heptose 1-phosphate adenosyltransferase
MIFKKFLDLEKNKVKIGVAGDAMIDEYYNVHVKKISPEFPIPVMASEHENSIEQPGGAANVAYQFQDFNADVSLISFLDQNAKEFFISKGLNVSLSVEIDSKIPRKKRFYSDGFPTYRWDVENKLYGLKDIEYYCNKLKNKSFDQKFDCLIFSDYEKGVFYNEWPQELIKKYPLTIVDPKSIDIEKWKGCSVFKPNAKEAFEITGKSNLLDAGKFLRDNLECDSVVITNAGENVLIISNQISEIKPEKRINARSVIGAGDCFVAFLSLALAKGFSIEESVEISWKAGLNYVQNKYNQPLKKNIFLDNLEQKKLTPDFSQRDYKLVFTNGCFDGGLTAGHIECLKFAKQQGDKLIVAINSDNSIKKLKGQERPFVPLDQRIKIVSALEFVDYVVSFEEDTPFELIKKIQPDIIVKGGDYNIEDVVGNQFAEVRICPKYDCLSTTQKSEIKEWRSILIKKIKGIIDI